VSKGSVIIYDYATRNQQVRFSRIRSKAIDTLQSIDGN
jgi:hypothetical protein